MECKNCKNTLLDNSLFCNVCGARVIRNRLTVKNLFQHFAEEFLNYDNLFLKTIRHLFLKPSEVIENYVTGTRKKYLNPVSFFAITLTLSGISVLVLQKFYPNAIDFNSFYTESVSQEVMTKFMSASLEYNSFIYSAMIPFLAIMSFTVFWNKKYNLTEHIVMYLYTMSLISLTSIILGQLSLFFKPSLYTSVSLLVFILAFIYHCFLYTKLFKLSALQLVFKILLFIPVFIIFYFMFSIVLFVLFMLTGSVSLQDFAPPN